MSRPNNGAKHPRWILGLDPGTQLCGFCLGKVNRPGSYRAEQMGTIVMPRGELHERLGFLKGKLDVLLDEADRLDAECVVETPLVFGANAATLAIAGVRGLILAMIGERRLRFHEYLPNVWKQVVGSGGASKDRVAHAVRNFLNLPSLPAFDAADAAGLFLYHATTRS